MQLNKRLLQIAATRETSLCEGPGVRFVVWVQGCTLKCKGCFNPHFWGQIGGSVRDVESVFEEIIAAKLENPKIEGVTFLGGEPFEQATPLAFLARMLQNRDFSIMVFSGYTMDELKDPTSSEFKERDDFITSIDLLVDGRYQEDNLDQVRPWVGSKNQNFHFLTDRYSPDSLFENVRDGLEITVFKSGELRLNGWATNTQLENLLEHL